MFKDIILLGRLVIARLLVLINKFLRCVFDVRSVTEYLGSYNIHKDTDKEFNFARYATDSRSFSTWLDKIYDRSPLNTFFTSFSLCAVIYFGGLMMAYAINFQWNYVQSVPIYLGITGILLVIVFVRYGSRQIHTAYEQLRPCFLITDSQYNYILIRWYQRLSNNLGHWVIGLLIVIFFWAAIFCQFFDQELLLRLHIKSFSPEFFKTENWYTPGGKSMKTAILFYYAFFVGLPLGTAGRILILNFFMLFDFKNLPVIPLPHLLRGRLRKTASFYITISITWFVGVALFGVLFFTDIDFFSTALLLVLSLLGIITFITPQVIYRILIDNSESLSNQWHLALFYKKFNINLIERENNSLITTQQGIEIKNLKEWRDFENSSLPVKKWVYDFTDLATFLIGQAIALVSPWLGKFLEMLKT